MIPATLFPKAVQEFNDALASKRLHHAWLLQGQAGIGKRLLSEYFALCLLGNTPQVQGLIEQKAHPDLKILDECDGTEKTGILSVDTVRGVLPFLNETKALSPYKVLIIDCVDRLNHNAVNAALKCIEEPKPDTVMLLINHTAASIPATLRSRCRALNLAKPNLDQDSFKRLLQQLKPDAVVDSILKDNPHLLDVIDNRISIAQKLLDQDPKHLTAFQTIINSKAAVPQIIDACASLKDSRFLKGLAGEHLIARLQQHIKEQSIHQNPANAMDAYLKIKERFHSVETLNTDWGQVYLSGFLKVRKLLSGQ